jgi:hypothetical protein
LDLNKLFDFYTGAGLAKHVFKIDSMDLFYAAISMLPGPFNQKSSSFDGCSQQRSPKDRRMVFTGIARPDKSNGTR